MMRPDLILRGSGGCASSEPAMARRKKKERIGIHNNHIESLAAMVYASMPRLLI